MKKKFFSFIVAFAFILTGAICMTACGGDKETRYYYDIDMPGHIVKQIGVGRTDSDGKAYVLEDEEFSCSFYAEDGYEISGSLTLKVDGTTTEWTSTSGGTYTYTFTPDDDFDIKVEGTVVEKYCDVSFSMSSGMEETNFEGVYIKYGSEEEQTLVSFLNDSSLANKNLKYGSTVEFWIYTYGYKGKLEVSGINNEFYHEGEKFGYHVCEEIADAEEISFSNSDSIYKSYIFSENSSSGDGINERNGQGEPYSITDSDIYIRLYMSQDQSKLVLELKKDIPEDVLDALKLKINGKDVALTFNKDLADMVKAEVELLKPYEYSTDFAYTYQFDLNFYKLSYFDSGVIHNGR